MPNGRQWRYAHCTIPHLRWSGMSFSDCPLSFSTTTQCQDLLTLPPVTCSKILSAKFQLTVLCNTCQVLVYVSLLPLRCHFPFQCNVKYKQWGDCTNGLKSDDHAPDCIWASNSFGDTGTYILRQVLRFTLRASGLGTPAHTLDLKFNLADQVVQHCMVHIWKPVFEEYG